MRLVWGERKGGRVPSLQPSHSSHPGTQCLHSAWERDFLFDGDNDSCSGRGKGFRNTKSIICAHTWV